MIHGFEGMHAHTMQALAKVINRMDTEGLLESGVEPEQLHSALRVDSRYTCLFDSLLQLLRESDYLRQGGNGLLLWGTADHNVALSDFENALLQDHYRLLTHCLKSYPEVLRGEYPATDLLFEGRASQYVKNIYQGNVTADYFNQVLARLIAGVECDSMTEPIRILEFGAGTGGTTETVLKALRESGLAGKVSYSFTDISQAFINEAKARFEQDYPFVTYQVLDIEKATAPQGFEPESYDLVLGANVLHATRDIVVVLQRLKRLMKSKGHLILNEATNSQFFTTMTFGLLEGWWQFEDSVWRLPGGPLLSMPDWKAILQLTGFQNPMAFGLSTHDGIDLGQHVIVSQNDGWCLKTEAQVSETIPTNTDEPKVDAVPSVSKTTDQPIQAALEVGLSEFLGVETSAIDPDQPFKEMGVDSLLAIQLAASVGKQVGCKLRSTDFFNYATPRALVSYLAGKTSPSEEALNKPATVKEERDDLLTVLENLAGSEQDVEDALEKVRILL